MRYAIELTPDDSTTRALRDIQQRLAGIAATPAKDAADLHITIGACDALDVTACSAILSEIASAPVLPCRFDSLGIFAAEPAVVFVAPVVIQELLVLHTAFHERFRPIVTRQISVLPAMALSATLHARRTYSSHPGPGHRGDPSRTQSPDHRPVRQAVDRRRPGQPDH